jgi:hypothetical protein
LELLPFVVSGRPNSGYWQVDSPGSTRGRGFVTGSQRDRRSPGRRGLTFAVAMMGLAGTWAIIEGIAAIANTKIDAGTAVFVFGNPSTWGWIVLGLGALLLLSAFPAFTGSELARWLGILAASLNGGHGFPCRGTEAVIPVVLLSYAESGPGGGGGWRGRRRAARSRSRCSRSAIVPTISSSALRSPFGSENRWRARNRRASS